MKRILEEKLRKEIREIEKELTVDLPREIAEAVALGDLSENAEYQTALERQSYLQNRLGLLKKQVENLSLVSENSIPQDRAALGSTVHLVNLDTGEEKTYEIVLGELADPDRGEISPSSPIGRALVNKEEGDEIVVITPRGPVEYEIVKIITIHDKVEEN